MGGVRREQLRALGRRTRQVLLMAGLTGALTGAAVAAFDWITQDVLFNHLRHLPSGVQAAAPLAGLLIAAASLRWLARGAAASTAEEYIKNFHEPGRRLDLRPLPGRIVASIATLGLGGAGGYEGPSIFLGAAIGSAIQARASRMFSRDDAKVLLVAGAAAGVAAIFRAPATGLVFALEVPYRDDLARRMLLPAAIAAASGYVVFVAFHGTSPLIPVKGSPPFDLRDLAGAVVVGVACGIGARWFTRALVWAKRRTAPNVWARAAAAGFGLGAFAVVSTSFYGSPLTLGPGYDNLQWAFNPRRALVLVAGLLVLRAAATVLTVAGGGVVGLFIPLVIEGALVGRVLSGLFRTPASGSNFFPLIGVSAFLGAGYRVPLSGVMFAAEASGRPGFIVPGLIAAVVAQLFMGSASASSYQVSARAGHLERRFRLPLATALRRDVVTEAPGTTLEAFFTHAVGRREHAVPVVGPDGRYLGMMRVEELAATPHEAWATTPVDMVMRTDFPTARLAWRLQEALSAMEAADVDLLPVLDGERFVGVVTTAEIVKLDDILEVTGEG